MYIYNTLAFKRVEGILIKITLMFNIFLQVDNMFRFVRNCHLISL